MTTTPRMETELTSWRTAPPAPPPPPSLSPRPTQRPAAIAPASVTRTSSSARLRSGASRREPAVTVRDDEPGSGVEAALMVADCPRSGLPNGSWDTRAVTSQPEPSAKPAKPRLLQDGRDMFWSIAPLVVACIVLAGVVGMCSFSPSGTNRGPVPPYNAASALKADALTLGFPVRLPRLPEGWQANSGGRGGIADGRTDPSGNRLRAVTSIVGYLSPRGEYLSLTQSNADE